MLKTIKTHLVKYDRNSGKQVCLPHLRTPSKFKLISLLISCGFFVFIDQLLQHDCMQVIYPFVSLSLLVFICSYSFYLPLFVSVPLLVFLTASVSSCFSLTFFPQLKEPLLSRSICFYGFPVVSASNHLFSRNSHFRNKN